MSLTITEADILDEVLSPKEGNLKPEAAEALLNLRFSDETLTKIRDLLDGQNRDELSGDDQQVLKKYLRVGQLIDLLQAKARLSLKA